MSKSRHSPKLLTRRSALLAGLGGMAGAWAARTSVAAAMEPRLKLPSEITRVPGASVIARMEGLRKDGRGYPVILGSSEDVERYQGTRTLLRRDFNRLVEKATRIDLARWFRERKARNPNPDHYKPPRGDWPTESQPTSKITGHLDVLTGKPYSEAFIGLLPQMESWKVPCALGFGGWNACPRPEEHSAVLKYWQDKYRAEVVTVAAAVIELRVQQPPVTREQALALAKEQFVYCTESVYQGTGTVDALAATLLGASVWFFWWD